MKKYYRFLLSCLAGSCVFSMAACSDDEDPAGQVQFGTSGCIVLSVDYQQTEAMVDVNVVNRNQQPETVSFSLFSQEELDAYNQRWQTRYRMMPEDAYLFETSSVSFTVGETQKSVPLKVYPDKLYGYLLTQLESADNYCLPLKMTDGRGAVDEVVYVAELSYPQMCITSGSEIELSMDKMTADITLEASIYDKGFVVPNGEAQAFSLRVATDNAQWLADFNAAHGTEYSFLPEGYYSWSQIEGAAEESKCAGTVSFDRRPEGMELLAKGGYVLPLLPQKLSEESVQLKYDTVAVIINNPEHVYTSSDKVDRSNWRIVFCNSDMGVWNSDGIITNILDGNTNTFWASWYKWWDGQDTWWNDNGRGNDWCDYGLEFMTYKEQNGVGDMFSEGTRHFLSDDYIFIAGNRDYPTFVIDMGQEYYVSEVGMQHRAQIQYAQTASADIYISNDPEFKLTTVRDGGSTLGYEAVNENNWVHVCTINTERTTDEFWSIADLNDARATGASKGRFLKFVSRTVLPEGNTEHDNSLQYAGVGEIYLKVVAEVDGEPYVESDSDEGAEAGE